MRGACSYTLGRGKQAPRASRAAWPQWARCSQRIEYLARQVTGNQGHTTPSPARWAAFARAAIMLPRDPCITVRVSSTQPAGLPLACQPRKLPFGPLLEPSQHVILSSEAFGNVNPACPRFIETFRAFDFVRVVVVYRNAASYSLSEHAQRIAEGSGRALHWQPFAFPNQTMQMSVEADCLTRLNYFAKVTRSWSDAFGRSSLSVLDLDGLAAGGMDPASAVVRAGFYQLGFPQLRAQERHNAGAAQHGMFLPLRQLLIEVLQADPVCNFSPRLPVNQRLLHNVSMQHWNSADPSAYFTKSLPKSMPVDCSHRLSQQCRSAATKQAQDFYAQLDVMGVERHFFNASATLSAAASTELPCELDREALRQEEIAIWRPWMCSELLHMSVH